jgi:CheY-like chemotaxis protein
MAEQKLILIVDDEPAFREIFGTKLGAEGFRVETAENGEVALAKAKALKPDLILMDVKMPVMDGATAVLKLREDPEIKDMKVVFLTSIGDPGMEMQEINQRRSKNFGAQGYLKKTDDLDHLSGEIKKILA